MLAGPDLYAALPTDGFTGGLIVHLDCGDGKQTATLPKTANCVVHALDADTKNVDAARAHLKSLERHGQITVGRYDGKRLPYTDNLVNLLVCEKDASVPRKEILRVLVPRGIAWINGKKTVKPWPSDIDEWSHFLHAADGNAVATDERVHNPRRIQWWFGPRHTRDHDSLASMSAMVSCRGRLFYILDEGPTSHIHQPAEWKLIARDVFNGALLWKRPIKDWVTHLYSFRVGPVWLGRKLVAVDDRVYTTMAFDAPVSALDTVTGETKLIYKGSEKTEEIIWHDGILMVAIGDPGAMNAYAPKPNLHAEIRDEDGPRFKRAVIAYDAKTGKRLWKRGEKNLETYVPLSLSALGEKAFFMDSEKIYCVEARTGKDIWRTPFATRGLFLRNYTPTFVASEKAVVCVSDEKIAAFATADGKQLWHKDQGFYGFGSPGDLFVIGDSVWTGHTYKGDLRDIQEIDLLSGEVKRTFSEKAILPSGHHHRCYRNRATERYLIMGRRCVEFVDLEGDEHQHNWFVRGLCQYGILPSNGQLIVPPTPCRCFANIKANGFWSFVSRNHVDDLSPDGTPLFKGPAYSTFTGSPPPAPEAAAPAPEDKKAVWNTDGVHMPSASDWPTYRHDIARSGSVKTDIPAGLKQLWKTRLCEQPRSPVSVGGKVFVPSYDQGSVTCLDTSTGKTIWEFTAGAAVDSAPTVHRGLVIFGAHDGYVYAVTAAKGELVWRYRAAPVDNLIMEEGRLSSAWPVHGSVLVLNDTAYFAAGRSSFVDGGIRIYGVDAVTGERKYHTTIATQSPRPSLDKPDPGPVPAPTPAKGKRTKRVKRPKPKSSTTTPAGLLIDVMHSDGQSIFMRHQGFGLDLAKGGKGRGLCTNYGFLSDSWMHRVNWTLGGGISYKSPFGKLLVFDANLACGAQSYYSWQKSSPWKWPSNHTGHHHQKYSRYQPTMFPFGVRLFAQKNESVGTKEIKTPHPERIPNGFARWAKPAASSTVGHMWTEKMEAQVRAMVLTSRVLFCAGWKDSIALFEETKSPDTGKPALWAIDRATGKTLAEYPLPAAPVFDGMIAANGKLFITLRNGEVACYAGKYGRTDAPTGQP